MKRLKQLWSLGFLAATVSLAATLAAGPVLAGTDDDTQKNNVAPVLGTPPFSDNPTNASPTVGLRIFPPTNTTLIKGQRFDLRVETQVPSTNGAAPVLKSLTINGIEASGAFNRRITAQGLGLESGTPSVAGLYGASVRNLALPIAGTYVVKAVVTVDGVDYTISNQYTVSPFSLKPGIKHVVFFLGDAMGLPIRSAARIQGKGIFEGRAKGRLNMDTMDTYGLVSTASFDSVITDSAPGMTSYVSGMKQSNNALNVSVDNTPENNLDNPRIETLWEYMKRNYGWATGVVSDAFITDATPAAEAGHSRARSARTAIAQQFLDYYVDSAPSGTPAQPATGYVGLSTLTQPLDVILGGGAVDWLPVNDPTLSSFYQYAAGKGRADGLNLFSVATSLGYSVVKDKNELAAAPNNKSILGIFVGDVRPGNALGLDSIPGVLDRLVARGQATIGGRTASDPSTGLSVAPPVGTGCGATVQTCFANIPSKPELVAKAIDVLNAKNPNGWVLLVEQSQTDKLAHPLEYERVVYEALELDNTLGFVLDGQASDNQTLTLVSADHAQPETIIGITVPSALDGLPGYFGNPSGTDPITPGGCFSNTLSSDSTSGALTLTVNGSGTTTKACALQDAIGTFNDGTFPTYVDANTDGFPDDPDPTVKLVLDDGGRPTYTQDFLTNPIPLSPGGTTAAVPNPSRDPNGLLLTGNMPTTNVSPISKNEGNIGVAPHSGEDVVLSASGPNAFLFGGTYENTDVLVRIAQALSIGTTNFGSRRALLRDASPKNAPAVSPEQLFSRWEKK
ncbi:alkaline phosphatase [Gloeobacter kilaueensis]|uniref:Alkaline phosphatase n=1 Tax=Gloeobacter kilaueensis (strain ATCC BAA-2537 / CCAP 1431/1 / ULC 316 / JS1) TaxID=1183438 RepID=U5QFP1_GLOK1|nr:alkaline phosphatase [Gloeobacter kilaueensis]AGY56495.1 alkaline phosphatase [Gloeobacter kilaueensis JS1]